MIWVALAGDLWLEFVKINCVFRAESLVVISVSLACRSSCRLRAERTRSSMALLIAIVCLRRWEVKAVVFEVLE